jgi:hypothetical protein
MLFQEMSINHITVSRGLGDPYLCVGFENIIVGTTQLTFGFSCRSCCTTLLDRQMHILLALDDQRVAGEVMTNFSSSRLRSSRTREACSRKLNNEENQ